MKPNHFLLLLITFTTGCIGDDVIFDEVPEALVITNPPDTIGLGDTYLFEAMFTNNIGVAEQRSVNWVSMDPVVVNIDPDGLATGLTKGTAMIIASVEGNLSAPVADTAVVVVDEETVVMNTTRSGVLETTSSYNLQGTFEVTESPAGIIIAFEEDYEASTALPGLYIYLGNNPSSVANAFEIGLVEVYNGSHSYSIDGVGINDFKYLLYWCKPFNVKVGEGVME